MEIFKLKKLKDWEIKKRLQSPLDVQVFKTWISTMYNSRD